MLVHRCGTRGAPKAPIIPAQPSGLGNRTGEAKALKARSISIPVITLVAFGPMSWRQQSLCFLETPPKGLLARCGTSILLNDFGNWAAPLALGVVFWCPCPGALPGRCPRLVWGGPLARVTPSERRTRSVHVRKAQTPVAGRDAGRHACAP